MDDGYRKTRWLACLFIVTVLAQVSGSGSFGSSGLLHLILSARRLGAEPQPASPLRTLVWPS